MIFFFVSCKIKGFTLENDSPKTSFLFGLQQNSIKNIATPIGLIYTFRMSEIISEYQGDLRCLSWHEGSGEEIMTDAPVDNHGKGEFFSPTDLLASSLGACMATIMGIQANVLKVALKGMTFTVEKTMSADQPRRISNLSVTFFIPCNPSDRHKELLKNLRSG